MQVGYIGFGKMGKRMVLKLLEDNHEVIGWNRSSAPVEELKTQIANLPTSPRLRGASKSTAQNLKIAKSIQDLVEQLDKPRIIWLMLTAGMPTEEVLSEVAKYVESGDIVIDGGNAFYLDTQRRFETFALNKIRFLGIGVSGGIHALGNGYPLMAGGDESAYTVITPILDALAKPHGPARNASQPASQAERGGQGASVAGGGHAYFGTGGAGHFVKMVHNGIEYGMMQAMGEGFGVLDKSPYPLDLLEVSKLWQKGTIVSGFLMDRAADVLMKDKALTMIDGVIAAGGEAEWTVEQAKKEDVPIENIEQSLKFRLRSQTDTTVSDSFAAKMIAALRHEFGGHAVQRTHDARQEVKKG